MLQDWEAGLVGNNPGIVARLPRRLSVARVAIDLVRRRRVRLRPDRALPSAA
ncbi:hypothetical protein N0B51_02430 [Tsuneonella sp. YG55]|uniref:Uncharacterized protein n=1 Tax=Tsuneonella litorea TaxID=2976475 RepID=A0A9X2VYT2_9SPHN|nr:hypothetical protein [Tsuneonella litorea]MCT2557832.1 hypothetical protein [Tsuneonella litorea]